MKLVFRFDIDTHKCIRDGVPNLLDLSEEMGVSFSFFLNLGKSVSLWDSLLDIVGRKAYKDTDVDMMSALDKLGLKEYIIAALINPNIYRYRKEIIRLCNSTSEVGIHGGKNHAIWQKHVRFWDEKRVNTEVEWAINKLKEIFPEYKLKGFASPGWEEPECLKNVLKDKGFLYSADLREKDEYGSCIVKKVEPITKIGVNLLGEPGGVAFFENCRVKGWSTDKIIDYVLNSVKEHDTCVLYDHPYYAGIKEISTIKEIIKEAIKAGIDIVCLRDLL